MPWSEAGQAIVKLDPRSIARERLRDGLARALRGLLRRARFTEAFRIADLLAATRPSAEDIEVLLLHPCVDEDGRRLKAAELEALWAALSSRPIRGAAPWRRLLRAALLYALERHEAAFEAASALEAVPAPYAWMRGLRAEMRLRIRREYALAERELGEAFRAAPEFWKWGALQAEAALCLGWDRRAFELMGEVVDGLRDSDRASALAWRGELRLWRGDDRLALEDLDEAVARGAALAPCWRAAARLRLGRAEEAAAELDAYLRRFPGDAEAWTWRGEAARALGRQDEALAALEKALSTETPVWPRVLRALVLAESGDAEGFRAEHARIPEQARRRFKAGPGDAGRLAALEAMLRAAGGLRRGDRYLEALWLGPAAAGASK